MNDLPQLMKSRFHNAISDQPYYRIFAMPTLPNPEIVPLSDQRIRKILLDPPNRRYGNFGVTGILGTEISDSPEEINGPNITDGEIILLKSGFFEVRCPLSDTIQFQWRHEESGFSEQWLYPYVVCEFPVTFLRLAKEIYEVSGIDSGISIQQEYHNLTGFMLVGGDPASNVFGGYRDGRSVYEHSQSIVSKQIVASNFIPDHVAYDLVKDVYDSFGLDAQWIPAFDENHNFILQ